MAGYHTRWHPDGSRWCAGPGGLRAVLLTG